MLPEIETERLRLRPWRLEDTEAAFAIYGDPEVTQFLGADLPVLDLAAQREWLARMIERQTGPDRNGMGACAMVGHDTGEIVGTMLLKPLPPTTDEIEIGWHVARRAWGHGYATEAGVALLNYAFAGLALERVYAVIRPGNLRSMAVAGRLGMRWVERTERYYAGQDLDLFEMERAAFKRAARTT